MIQQHIIIRAKKKPRVASHQRRTDVIVSIILSIFAFIALFPYLFMLFTSLKDNNQFFQSYWLPGFPLHFENYITAWEHISGYLFNSIFIAVTSTIGVILLGSISAYVLAYRKLVGRDLLFTLFALLLMVPSIASLIPLFIMMRDFGLLNTDFVLIIPYVSTGLVLATVLMRSFIEQIPEELFEAARIDGASGISIYARIVMPLSGPIIGTIVILTLINVWNDYFWPLLTITEDNLRTVTIGVAFFQGQFVTFWGQLFAGYVLASLPLLLLFIFASRYFIAGIQGSSGGGIK